MAAADDIKDALHREVLEALINRNSREQKQAQFYMMRHDGIPRATKPWANAANLHFPLADSEIERIKPSFIQQIFGSELLASFYSLDGDFAKFQGSAEQWFDDRLRHQSNLIKQGYFLMDGMLQDGRNYLKIFWDTKKKQLRFQAVKDLYIVVPSWTTDLQETDWLVHIEQYSVAAYKREKDFNQDPDFIKKITTREGRDAVNYDTLKCSREGLTVPKAGQIIVWRRYERDGDGWAIRSYSPQAPDEDVCSRKPIPYQHNRLIFVPFDFEWKDEGNFSSRGIPERVAAFEAWLNRCWNDKADSMTLFNQPLLFSESRLATGNLRWKPGAILNQKVERVDLGTPPISYDQEMLNTRATAESLIQSPDFGIMKSPGQSPRTATEVDKISQLTAQSQNGRGFMLGDQLGDVYEQAWSLLVQYAGGDLNYLYRDTIQEVNPDALRGRYRIQPSGATDAWNKAARFQKAAYRQQTLQNNPNIKQDELTKDFLQADDPSLVKKLFRDTQTMVGDEMEHQAEEIGLMLMGFPAQVQPMDDDAIHMTCLAQYVQSRAAKHQPITPETAALFLGHLEQHGLALGRKNPNALKAIEAQYGMIFSALKRVAMTPQGQPQGAPGQPPQPQPPAPAPGPVPPQIPAGGVA